MFGLLKARACSLPAKLQLHRRLHYCGTCKTLGGAYSQKSRALLNHDTVFLAEVLTAISKDSDSLRTWDHAYQSFNCLALPKASAAMPLPLQVAAAATVFLTEFKIADHVKDTQKDASNFVWGAAQKIFSEEFLQVRRQLNEWRFPVEELQSTLRSQEQRETRARTSVQSSDVILPDDILDDLAEPTAKATALFCQHGARLVGQQSLEKTMYSLGYKFGATAYLIDAFEDYEKDARRGDFNAIREAYKLTDTTLPVEARRKIKEKVEALRRDIETALNCLPMAREMREMFASRLRSNLSRKLGGLPVLVQTTLADSSAHTSCTSSPRSCHTKGTLSERWRNALRFGRAAVEKYRTDSASRAAKLASPFVFATVLPAAFFAPHQLTENTSYRECLSLGMNLMFLGAVVNSLGALLTKPLRSVSSAGGHLFMSDPTMNAPGRKRRQQGGDAGTDGGSGCCDACDCCCCCEASDGCFCGNCSCDCCHCNCCDCNCCD